MYQTLKRDGIRFTCDTQKIIDALEIAAKSIKKTNSLAVLRFYSEILSEAVLTDYPELLENDVDCESVPKTVIKKVCRRVLRKIYMRVGDFMKSLWRKRISTASRSNANCNDKMLLMIPTPPTDDYTEDVSCQWGGGTIVLPV